MYPGRFFDGKTPVPREVKFVIEHRRIAVFDLEGLRVADWSPNQFFVENLGGRVRIVNAEDETISLEIVDPDGLRAARVFENRIADRNTLMIALMLATVGLCAVIYLCIPLVSRVAATYVPYHWEVKARPSMISAFDEKFCEDKSGSLQKMGQVLMGPDAEKFPVEIKLIAASDINAFALPGGLIVMNSGLIDKADDVTEVAGVLAHEIQHVMQRHIMAELIQSSFTLALWSFVFGDYSSFLLIDPSTAYKLADLKFSRDTESSADQGAFAMLKRAQISTKGMASFFRRIEKMDKWVPTIVSTHPSSDLRAQLAEAAGAEGNPKGPAMKELTALWKDLKSTAKTCL